MWVSGSVAVLLILFSLAAALVRLAAYPQIHITAAPGADPELRNIAGFVEGLGNPERYKVLIYAKQDHWYVQPFISQPLTDIDPRGTWVGQTHIGNTYGALVVEPSYHPEAILDALPPVEGAVKAKIQ